MSGKVFLNFLLRHWPKGVLEHDIILKQVVNNLDDLEKKYQKEPHPFTATEAFLLSRAAGLPVPLWAVEWMCNALETFNKTEGKPGPLQELLGFTSKQRSGTTFDIKRREDRNTELIFEVLVLNHFCMLPVVSAKALALEAHNRKSGATPLNPESFEKYYQKHAPEVSAEHADAFKAKRFFFGHDVPDFPLGYLLPYVSIALDSKIMSKADLVLIIAELAALANVITIDNSVEYAVAILDLISRNPLIVGLDRIDLVKRITEELSPQFPPVEN